MVKKAWFKFVMSILAMILLFFILAPILKLILGTEYEVMVETVQDKEIMSSILLTFYASLTATILSILTGVPLAYLLARVDFYGKSVVEGLINLPIIIPHTAAGIALLTVFGGRFFLGRFFNKLGINFVGSFYGIVIAMMFVSMPFLVNEAKEGFKSIDVRYEKVARSLGYSPYKTFMKVSFPMNLNHIISGSLLMWARGLSEFGAVVILAYHPMTAPILIYERFTSYGLKYATPVAAIMVIISIIIFTVISMINNNHNRSKAND